MCILFYLFVDCSFIIKYTCALCARVFVSECQQFIFSWAWALLPYHKHDTFYRNAPSFSISLSLSTYRVNVKFNGIANVAHWFIAMRWKAGIIYYNMHVCTILNNLKSIFAIISNIMRIISLSRDAAKNCARLNNSYVWGFWHGNQDMAFWRGTAHREK